MQEQLSASPSMDIKKAPKEPFFDLIWSDHKILPHFQQIQTIIQTIVLNYRLNNH